MDPVIHHMIPTSLSVTPLSPVGSPLSITETSGRTFLCSSHANDSFNAIASAESLAFFGVLLGVGICIVAKPLIESILVSLRGMIRDQDTVKIEMTQEIASVLEDYFWNAEALSQKFDDVIMEMEREFASLQKPKELRTALNNFFLKQTITLVTQNNLSSRQLRRLKEQLSNNISEIKWKSHPVSRRLSMRMKDNHVGFSLRRMFFSGRPIQAVPYAVWDSLVMMRALVLREVFTGRFPSLNAEAKREALILYRDLAKIFKMYPDDKEAGIEEIRQVTFDRRLQQTAQDVLISLTS